MHLSKAALLTCIFEIALCLAAPRIDAAQETSKIAVEINVTDSTGAPISRVQILIDHPSSPPGQSVWTSDNGHASLKLSPGRHVLSAAATGFARSTENIYVSSSSNQSLTVVLKLGEEGPLPVRTNTPFAGNEIYVPDQISVKQPTQAPPSYTPLTVTVIDTSGAFIPGAKVEIDPFPCASTPHQIADAQGVATLSATPGKHTLSITARGFTPWTTAIDVQNGVSQNIKAQLSVASTTINVDVTPVPDLILLNGTIVTGECLSGSSPTIVQAIAIERFPDGGKIVAVGTNEEIRALATTKTELRDLHGAFVMPGLNDAHVHLGGAGQTKLNIDLTGSASLKEMLQRIKDKADRSPAGHWLTGGGWDHTLWTDKTLPSRQDLDKITGGHPTLLERIDGHIAVANSAALKAASITGKTAAPQGGSIDLDPNGEPTGILRDTAMEVAEKIIPPPSHEDRKHGMELAIEDALSHGLTSVQDNSDWEDFLVMEELEKEGKLGLRISEWLPFAAPIEELKDHRAHHNANDPMLHTGMLKGFMDGSLGSRTAAMKAPYADDPKNSGLARYDQAKLNAMAIERAQAGFQMGFHAIGDLANAMALNAFQAAETATDPRPRLGMYPCLHAWEPHKGWDERSRCPASQARNRIEHAQVVNPVDILRFKQLNVIASMQPNHLLTDMNWAMDRLGPQRAAYSYTWKAFLDEGTDLAFGTDYPVEPVTPFRGLYSAVTRANEARTKTYFPEDKLTIGEAIYAYTQGSAYAEFAEKRKGKLTPGFEADLILVDRNLLTVPPPEILKTKVLETVVSGKTVYAAKP